MKRMLAHRGVVLGAIVFCATALVGAAGFLSLADDETPTGAKKSAPALLAKQASGQDPRCALQDKDDKHDDVKESKVKKAKPDTDDDELECGDQNDDDREVGEDKDRKPGEHAKKVLEKKPAGATAAKPAAGK